MQQFLRTGLLIIALFCSVSFAYAGGIKYPVLTGRVVDNARLLSASAIDRFTAELQAQEDKTGEQVVVVTLPSLQGQTIENYGYQLGRHWGIGQKGKDNGVLLIIAPHERKVRIEVGYGLEGTLTDAISSQIVYGIILPDFRQNQMEIGINEGLNAILHTLNGQALTIVPSEQVPAQQQQADNGAGAEDLVIFLLLMVFIIWINAGSSSRLGGSTLFLGGGSSSGFSGFSGGGGGFGGGGCSGGW
jgi:uncharacterized protein